MAKVIGIISRTKAKDEAGAVSRLNKLVTEVASSFAELHARFLKQDYILRYNLPSTTAGSTTQVAAIKASPTVPSGLYRVRWYAEASGDGTYYALLKLYVDGKLYAATVTSILTATQAWSGFFEGSFQAGTHTLTITVAASNDAGEVTLTGGQLVLERLVA